MITYSNLVMELCCKLAIMLIILDMKQIKNDNLASESSNLVQSNNLLIEQYSEYSLVYAKNMLIIVNVTHIENYKLGHVAVC